MSFVSRFTHQTKKQTNKKTPVSLCNGCLFSLKSTSITQTHHVPTGKHTQNPRRVRFKPAPRIKRLNSPVCVCARAPCGDVTPPRRLAQLAVKLTVIVQDGPLLSTNCRARGRPAPSPPARARLLSAPTAVCCPAPSRRRAVTRFP